MTTTFGDFLRGRRRTAGVSQRTLAELAGVDFSYISKLENGRLPPPAAGTLVRLADCVSCPREEMLAAARKLPAGVGSSLSADPTAQRFLQEASELSLSSAEWEHMRVALKSLRGKRRKN